MSYADFMQNPYIARIAKYPSWTISDKEKRPVDIVKLIESIDPNNPKKANLDKLPLAKFADNRCLVNLETLLSRFPNAANLAYYVQNAAIDGFVILDVEKTCPEELKSWFLRTNYVYGEYSMSGKGYHLVYPTPACFANYPQAQKKIKMQAKDKSYEFMIGGHYLTFTGKMLPPATGTLSIDNVFEALCKEQVHVDARDVDISVEKPVIPNEEMLLTGLQYVQIKKTLADFNGDESRYEFGACAKHYNQLKRMLLTVAYNPDDVEYTDNQKAWLVYQSVSKAIKHRAKHDSFREHDGQSLPWLLWMACQVIAKDSTAKSSDD